MTNNDIGLTSAWGHYLYAGLAETPTTGYSGSYNSIYSNNNYDATAYESGYLMAQVNWWGSDGVQVSAYSGGYILSTFPMSSDPWGSIALKPIADNTKKTVNTVSSDINDLSDILSGIKLESEGRTNEAVNHYMQMINNNSHTIFALSSLLKIKNNNKMEGIESYIANISTAKKSGNNRRKINNRQNCDKLPCPDQPGLTTLHIDFLLFLIA